MRLGKNWFVGTLLIALSVAELSHAEVSPPPTADAASGYRLGTLAATRFFLSNVRLDGDGRAAFWMRTYEMLRQTAAISSRLLSKRVLADGPGALAPEAVVKIGRVSRDLDFISHQYDGAEGNWEQWEAWARGTAAQIKKAGQDLNGALGTPPATEPTPEHRKALVFGIVNAAADLSNQDWSGEGAREYWQRTYQMLAFGAACAYRTLNDAATLGQGALPEATTKQLVRFADALKKAALRYISDTDPTATYWRNAAQDTGLEIQRIARELRELAR
jgi:hypothetical protein